MSALGSKLRLCEGNRVMFWCPGCEQAHAVRIGAGSGERLGFNGNWDAPTFTPSVLVRTGHYATHFKADDDCWCTYNAEQRAKGEPETKFGCVICHSFVTNGQIRFLDDCTHHLKGQTVPLPDFP